MTDGRKTGVVKSSFWQREALETRIFMRADFSKGRAGRKETKEMRSSKCFMTCDHY